MPSSVLALARLRRRPLAPPGRISLALAVTNGPAAAATELNYSQALFASITEYLTPGHPAG